MSPLSKQLFRKAYECPDLHLVPIQVETTFLASFEGPVSGQQTEDVDESTFEW